MLHPFLFRPVAAALHPEDQDRGENDIRLGCINRLNFTQGQGPREGISLHAVGGTYQDLPSDLT